MPGPVPHPGFQKQEFTRNVGLFLGGSGAGLPCPIPPNWGVPGLPGRNYKYIFLITARGQPRKSGPESKSASVWTGLEAKFGRDPAEGRPLRDLPDSRLHPKRGCTLDGCEIFELFKDRKSVILGVWVAPGAPEALAKGGRLRPPPA